MSRFYAMLLILGGICAVLWWIDPPQWPAAVVRRLQESQPAVERSESPRWARQPMNPVRR